MGRVQHKTRGTPVAAPSLVPTPHEILAGLEQTANDWIAIAAVWHAVLAVALVTVVSGVWRPSQRTAAAALAILPASVSVFAWLAGNPFNGVVFAVATLLLGALALRLPNEPLARAPSWALAAGALAFTYAWFYPHFLDDYPFYLYAAASPLGLVPCPTLSAVLAFGLLCNGFGSRAWSLAASVLGLAYAGFGIFRLGVVLDLGLLFAAVSLAALALMPRPMLRAAPARP